MTEMSVHSSEWKYHPSHWDEDIVFSASKDAAAGKAADIE